MPNWIDDGWTGHDEVARLAQLVLGRPAVVFGLILAGLVVRWLLHRIIDRVVRRAERGLLPSRISTLSVGNTTLGAAIQSLEGKTRGGLSPNAPADTTRLRGDDGQAHRRISRARTMGSVLKSVATGVIFTAVVLTSLSELNFDIAPLLASAGIAGIAFGFGAQSLIKDFLAGLFMIFEDQYGVGDTVDLGDAIGTVEAVSLRVTRLRDADGTVWYVRNGEILRVGNRSQNWARVGVDVAVSYAEDPARVCRVLGEVAHEMWTDDDLTGRLIEEPDVLGVEHVVADTVTMRVLLKTAPLEQLGVARIFRERVKARFELDGIEVPTHPPTVPGVGGAAQPGTMAR
ncbi:MAG: mechanosensitive ion channel family protein [Nocardioides sp.]